MTKLAELAGCKDRELEAAIQAQRDHLAEYGTPGVGSTERCKLLEIGWVDVINEEGLVWREMGTEGNNMTALNTQCLKKTRFASEQAAKLTGFRVYRCSFCSGFHRTTGANTRKMPINPNTGEYFLKGVR